MKIPSTARSGRHVPLVLLAFACACSDGPVSPRIAPEPAIGRVLVAFECTVETESGAAQCQPATAETPQDLRLAITLSSPHVTVAGSGGVSYRVQPENEDTTVTNVSVTNNITQPLGTMNGIDPHADGTRLVFTFGPNVTAVKSGTIAGSTVRLDNYDGLTTIPNAAGTQTYIDRPFYQYNGVVPPSTATASKPVRFVYSSNVKTYGFSVVVSAPVQYEHGWITVSPATPPVIAVDSSITLSGVVRDQFGGIQSDAINWSSSNTAIATVDASGVVTGVDEGTATITATSSVNAQRTGMQSVTVDRFLTVTSTNPADETTGVAPGSNIEITFSETVDVASSSFSLECPSGSARAFTVSGSGTSTVTLNPDSDLPAATTCHVTVIGNQVSDSDTNDGPNLMPGNYSFNFDLNIHAINDVFPETIRGPINTANTSPVFSVTTNDDKTASTTISFAGWRGVAERSMEGGQFVMTTSGAGMGRFIYYPPAGYEGTDSLEYTIQSGASTSTAKVALPVQAANPADAAPAVLSTTPEDGATPVASDADIIIFFSEAVNVSTSSFLLECPIGEDSRDFAVSGSGTSTITLNPHADLPELAICTVTVAASVVSDADANDGPDVMDADYVFSFEVGITFHP